MLYVTTRDKVDAFTPHRALTEERGKCGGCYLPYRLPVLMKDQLHDLVKQSFSERIATVLRLFFPAKISGWEVEVAVGRYPVRIAAMNHKIAVVETWHNHDGSFDCLVEKLYHSMTREEVNTGDPGAWFRIAARIAVLAAALGELMKTGIADTAKPADISLPVNDFEGVMAAWYARKMGLPLGVIMFVCNDNSSLWDFFHNGELQTNSKIRATVTPDSDQTVPQCLEMLIYETLGFQEVQRFVNACQYCQRYDIREDQLAMLKDGLFCGVVRQHRLETVISNIYCTNSYLMDPYTALAFGGLQDYRASAGETGIALILSDQSPICALSAMERILGIPAADIQKIVDHR